MCVSVTSIIRHHKLLIQHFLSHYSSFVTIKDDFPPPTLYRILQLYSQMTHGVNLKTLCIRLSPRQHNIDERKLVVKV